MDTLEKLRSRPHWSYSALNTYLNICQLQYYFRYVEQAESERSSSCFAFGRVFHRALTFKAQETLKGSSVDDVELLSFFAEQLKIEVAAEANLIFKDNESIDTLIELGARMLPVITARWPEDIRAVAVPFSVEVQQLDRPLIGEFDMVVANGSGGCIVDWKSSAARWPSSKAGRDLQATVFSYAYSKLHGESPLFRYDVVTKAKTPSFESHYTMRTDDDFERLERLFALVQNAIDSGVFLPSETSFACADCAYKRRCRSWHRRK